MRARQGKDKEAAAYEVLETESEQRRVKYALTRRRGPNRRGKNDNVKILGVR
jgi:hypothetical protein